MNRCQFVDDHQRRHGVKRRCDILGVSRSSFYHWRRTADARAARQTVEAELAARIRAVHQNSDGTYGAPRTTAELRDEGGPVVKHKRVARIMRTIGLEGVGLRRRHRTTVADQEASRAPELIDRDLTAAVVNTKYVGDITYPPGRREVPLHGHRHRPRLTLPGRLGDRRSHAHRSRHRRLGGRRANPREPDRSGGAHRPRLAIYE